MEREQLWSRFLALSKGVKRKGQPGFEQTYPYRKIRAGATTSPHIEKAQGHIADAVQVLRDGGHHDHADALEKLHGRIGKRRGPRPGKRRGPRPGGSDSATPEGAKHDVHGALDRIVQADKEVREGRRSLQTQTKAHVWDHQSAALALLLHHTPVAAIRNLHPSHLKAVRNMILEVAGSRTLQGIGKQWGVPKHNPLHGRRHVLEHIAGPGNEEAPANEGVSIRQHLTRELLKHAEMPDHVRAKVAEHVEHAAASAEQDKEVGPRATRHQR